MLSHERGFRQCAGAEIVGEGYKRTQLARRNFGLSEQFQNSRFEGVIFFDQPCIGLLLRAGITGFDIVGSAPTNSPNSGRASIGLEFAALELLDRG